MWIMCINLEVSLDKVFISHVVQCYARIEVLVVVTNEQLALS